MVMDNMEDVAPIRNAWPFASYCATMVISRNDIVGIDPAAFSKDGGASFLMSIIGRGNYSSLEADAARRLSARLGGLAMALTTMAS